MRRFILPLLTLSVIATAQEALDEASQEFAARRMDRGIRTALSGRALEDVARRIGGAAE